MKDNLIHTAFAQQKKISSLGLPQTAEGLLDMRGYSAPKTIRTLKSPRGNDRSYVSESIRIKKQVFDQVDFTGADFEACEFFHCEFTRCLFAESNLKETKFWGCAFTDTRFIKTGFTHAIFQPIRILFPERKVNFSQVLFDHCNLTGVTFQRQGLVYCHFIKSKLPNLAFYQCRLEQLQFTGTVSNMRIEKSRVQEVDLRQATVSGLQVEGQGREGLLLPAGYGDH